jgi:hypothetical protein
LSLVVGDEMATPFGPVLPACVVEEGSAFVPLGCCRTRVRIHGSGRPADFVTAEEAALGCAHGIPALAFVTAPVPAFWVRWTGWRRQCDDCPVMSGRESGRQPGRERVMVMVRGEVG